MTFVPFAHSDPVLVEPFTTPWKYPAASFLDVTRDHSWNNLANAHGDTMAVASTGSVTWLSNYASDQIIFYDFGFTLSDIPAGATLLTMDLEVVAACSASGENFSMSARGRRNTGEAWVDATGNDFSLATVVADGTFYTLTKSMAVTDLTDAQARASGAGAWVRFREFTPVSSFVSDLQLQKVRIRYTGEA